MKFRGHVRACDFSVKNSSMEGVLYRGFGITNVEIYGYSFWPFINYDQNHSTLQLDLIHMQKAIYQGCFRS